VLESVRTRIETELRDPVEESHSIYACQLLLRVSDVPEPRYSSDSTATYRTPRQHSVLDKFAVIHLLILGKAAARARGARGGGYITRPRWPRAGSVLVRVLYWIRLNSIVS
jgi:hypothetical protein